MLDRWDVKTQVKMHFFDVFFLEQDAPSLRPWLGRARIGRDEGSLPISFKGVAKPATHGALGKVARDREHHVLGRVVASIKVHHFLPGEAANGAFPADDGPM